MAFLHAPTHRASRTMGRGFTLLEALAALGILAIIMTLAMPFYQDTLRNQQLSDAANNVVTALQLARAEALKRQTRVAVCAHARSLCAPSSVWNEGWVVAVDDNRDQLWRGDDLIVRQFGGDHPAVRIFSSRAGAIIFDAGGRSAGSNTTLTICHPEAMQAHRVVLNNAGRMRTERTSRTGIIGCESRPG